jgi:CAAX protease family protein
MSFESAWNTTPLPEKPWTPGAVVRLAVCVFICMMMGGVVAMVFRYFETPQTSSAIRFVAVAVGAFASYAGAVVLLCCPWRSEERYLVRLIWLLSCIYGGIFLTWAAGKYITGKLDLQNPFLTLLIATISFQGATVVLVHFFLREHQTGWREGFGLDNRPALSMIIGVCAGILILFPALKLQELCIRLFEQLKFHPHEQETVEILRHTGGLPERVALAFVVILVAPIGEELLFRGILYPAVKRKFGKHIALWGTAILFGAIHVNLASFLSLVLLALVLLWLYEHTGNLLAPIAVHCVFNAANFVALYAQQI